MSEIKPSTVVACYGAVDAFRGEAGIADFLQSYGRLVDMIQKASGAAVIIVSPPPVQTLPPPFPDMTAQNARLALYRDALRGFAAERGLKFVDILTPLSAVPLQTVNGVNLTDEGYRAAAGPVARALGVDPGPSPDDLFARTGALRAAIVEKNRQFFYRWRPQNEIYLFGSRKHEQGQNGVEIPQFDPLVAAAEEKITALKAALKPAVP